MSTSVATQKNEEFYLNLKASIFKIATLNAPTKSQSSFTDEDIADLEVKQDVQQVSASSKPHLDELIKPPISKKPIIINHAKQFSNKQETTINISTTNNEDTILKQNILIKKHSNELTTMDQIKITGSIVPLSLAELNKETIEMQRLTDLRPQLDESVKLNITKEKQQTYLANKSQAELICEPQINKSDEFLECVKPMDTIEIDFNESISLKTTNQMLFSPQQNENKVNIKILQSLNRPSIGELPGENCPEFQVASNQLESVETSTEIFTTESVQVEHRPTQLVQPNSELIQEDCIVPIQAEQQQEDELITKEEINDLNQSIQSKQVQQLALGELKSETNLEEDTKELESIHLSLIEPSSPNKTIETKIDIVRIEKTHKQSVLNNPVDNFIETETVKRFQPEELDYERPKFGIEITEITDEKKVIRIKMLNSPYYNTEKFDDQQLDRIIPIINESDCDKAQTVISKNDCNLKANITNVQNYSMAQMVQSNTEEEFLKENSQNTKSQLEQAGQNVITNLNSFSQSNDIKRVKLDYYGRAQEIIEISNNTFTCDSFEPNQTIETDSFSLKLTTVPLDSHENNIQITESSIRNLANLNQLPAEQCQQLDINIPELIQPNQMIQSNTFEKTSMNIHTTSVCVQPNADTLTHLVDINEPAENLNQIESVEDLTQKADEKLLRWLNYPQSELNESTDETTHIDDKLDYLYEKINSEEPETNSFNIVKVEKVLNRIISNEEKLENEYELVQFVSQCRPELQQLINSNPVNEISSFKQTVHKPLIFNKEIVSDDLNKSFKTQDLVQQSENKCDAIETLTTDKTSSERHETESRTIFNLPSIGCVSRLDEMSTEFYNSSINENVCKETIELICFQTVSQIVKQSVINAPVEQQTPFENLSEIKPIDNLTYQLEIVREQENSLEKSTKTPLQELMAPYSKSYKYIEEKCTQFDTDITSEQLKIKKSPNQLNQICSLNQQIQWETIHTQESNDLIQQTSSEIVKQILLKSIIQSELQPNETIEQINTNYKQNIRNIEPKSTSSLGLGNNRLEQHEAKIENILNLNNTDDDIGSFIEQIEKIELISSDNLIARNSLPTEYHQSSLTHHTVEEEHVIHHSNNTPNATKSTFTIEKEKLNNLVQKIEIPKWEESTNMQQEIPKTQVKQSIVMTNLNDYTTTETIKLEDHPSIILNQTLNNDEDLSSGGEETSVNSSESSKIHLIESVEIVTHHDPNESRQNEYKKLDSDKVHIHKVDINRLQIREKSPRKYRDLDESSRFKVDFKQEEVIDLRDLTDSVDQLDEQSNVQDLANDKIFAKKFVDQIVQLSTSKLADYEAHKSNQIDYDESLHKYENLNFNKISNKSSSEILESLNNLKINIGKHLTESIIGKANEQSPIIDNNNYFDYDNDSLKEARDEFFENFDNRLHSTYNHGNNSTIINSSIDTEDYFSEKYEEEIEILKEASTNSNFQIPIHIEYEFNDQSFTNNKKVSLIDYI